MAHPDLHKAYLLTRTIFNRLFALDISKISFDSQEYGGVIYVENGVIAIWAPHPDGVCTRQDEWLIEVSVAEPPQHDVPADVSIQPENYHKRFEYAVALAAVAYAKGLAFQMADDLSMALAHEERTQHEDV